jgi:hypothetical protein
MIIDNVDYDCKIKEKDLLAYNAKEYLPQADHGSVLITGRLASMARTFEVESFVDRIDTAQARSILKSNVGRELVGALRSSMD